MSRKNNPFRPRKNIETILAAFARGDKPRRPGERIYCPGRRTCSTDGEKIYSYNEPIAIRLDDGTVVVRERWGTNTTSHHIRACKICLPQYGIQVKVVPYPREAVRHHERRHRYAAARPHGHCEFASRCVEHESNPDVPPCKETY